MVREGWLRKSFMYNKCTSRETCALARYVVKPQRHFCDQTRSRLAAKLVWGPQRLPTHWVGPRSRSRLNPGSARVSCPTPQICKSLVHMGKTCLFLCGFINKKLKCNEQDVKILLPVARTFSEFNRCLPAGSDSWNLLPMLDCTSIQTNRFNSCLDSCVIAVQLLIALNTMARSWITPWTMNRVRETMMFDTVEAHPPGWSVQFEPLMWDTCWDSYARRSMSNFCLNSTCNTVVSRESTTWRSKLLRPWIIFPIRFLFISWTQGKLLKLLRLTWQIVNWCCFDPVHICLPLFCAFWDKSLCLWGDTRAVPAWKTAASRWYFDYEHHKIGAISTDLFNQKHWTWRGSLQMYGRFTLPVGLSA